MAAATDERVRRIAGLAQRLLTDLARHGYGDAAELDCLAPACAARVRPMLERLSGSAWRVEADYGETVPGTAHLPDDGGAIRVELLVEDRSVARDHTGRPVPLPPMRWRLALDLDPDCTSIDNLCASPA
jgi:hypothetical protein